MQRLFYLAIGAAFSLMLTSVALAEQTGHVYGIHDRTNDKIALINATAVTEPGKIIENATIVIDNGRVLSVRKNGDTPKDAREINLTGHWVYPGFIDPYSDYVFGSANSQFRWGEPPQYEGTREGGNAWNDAIHSHIDWVDQFKPDGKAASAMIKNGFTSVQAARLDGIFQGRAVTVSLDDGVPNDLIYQAKARHFGSFNKGSSKQSYPSSLMGSIALIRQTLSDATWYQSAKGKVDSLITGEAVEYNAALENLTTAKSAGMIFHPQDSQSITRANKLFAPLKLDVAYLADGQEYARINDIKKTGATLIVPFNFPEQPTIASFEDQLDTSLAELRHFERATSNPAVLEQQGIDFAFTQHGLKNKKAFWKELKKATKHGLSEKAALAALTTTPARLAGISDQAGKITAGFRADLVVADGNLFADGSIKKVYLQGKVEELSPIAPFNFAGDYAFTLSDTALTLSVSQKDGKVSGTLNLANDDEKSVKIGSVQTQDNQLSFSANLTDLGIEGVYRFTGRVSGDTLNGSWLMPNLGRASASAKRTQGEEKVDDKKVEADQPVEYISNVTFPNRAFGLSAKPQQQNLHIKNATIWTSEDAGILEGADMIIRDGKIREIGKNLSTPRGYTTIDATGKHVTAGIIDEHSHVAISGGVNEGSDAITAEVRIGDVVNPEDINIYRALAGGTTAAQLLHGSANPVGGQAQVIKFRWGENAEGLKFKKAPASIKFALGENVKQSNWGDRFTIRYPQTRMGVDTIVRDNFIRAQEYRESFEAYDDLSRREKERTAPPRRNYRMDTLLEIIDSKRFVHAHSYVASEILALMDLAEDFGFVITTFTHILEGYKVADEMAKHGAGASTFADWWAYKFEVFDAIPGNACLMMNNGVLTSVNSDSGDLIRRLNTEAAKSINYCGMKPEDAIKMVTINAAKQLKIDRYTGSLKAGKDADFVIWNNNPLSIYAKVEQTWIDGRRYFERESDEKMRIALAEEKSQLIQKFLDDGKGASNGSAKSGPPSQFAQYLLKDNTVWHCEDNFDYWHYLAGQEHFESTGHHGGTH